MNYKNLFVFIASITMVLLIPIIIYLYNFNSIAFDENFYKKEFLKYNVYSNLRDYDIEKINNDVLNYLKYEKSNRLINNDFFNEREQSHLLDVKDLIQKTLTVYHISMILFLLFFLLLIFLLDFKIKDIAKNFFIILIFGSALALIGTFLFFILFNLNFNFLFDLFHKTFFPAGTYTFNPEFENIVILYPGNFFFGALFKITIKTILSSVIMLLISITVLLYFFRFNFLKIFLSIFDGKNKK